jgi:peptide-methionine (S)-S-oxide reductase
VTKTATFGAGCFWGVEAAFRQVDGVVKTRVGYSGGTLDNPTYEESYDELLRVFWRKHNPTQRNRQGWDFGDNYRSVVFFHDEEQRAAAEASKQAEQPNWKRPIVTQIEPAKTFYEAEDYHQQYLQKRGRASCTTALAQTG